MAEERDIDLVLVTGAGASRAFGVNHTQLPLMKEWSDHLVTQLRQKDPNFLQATGLAASGETEQFETQLGHFLRSVDAFKSVGHLLGPLTSIERNRRPAGNPQEWEQWHEALVFQLEQIMAVVHETLYEMFGAPSLDPDLARQAYGQLLTTLGIGSSSSWVCATTNYDPIAEQAIASIGGLPDVGEIQVPPGVSERPVRVDGLLGGMPRYVPVLHLHGRVGWFHRNRRGLLSVPIERYNSQIGTPLVMLPDLEKVYDTDPVIASLWQQFEEALARAQKVFVLGHSLHDRALVRALRQHVNPPARLAVSYLTWHDNLTGVLGDKPDGAEATSVRERIGSELPGALAIPMRFEAGIDFGSETIKAWLEAI